jgi:hypothetical protein
MRRAEAYKAVCLQDAQALRGAALNARVNIHPPELEDRLIEWSDISRTAINTPAVHLWRETSTLMLLVLGMPAGAIQERLQRLYRR